MSLANLKDAIFKTYRIGLLLTALILLQHTLPHQAKGQGDANQFRLFGTVEFKTPLKDMPKWQRILDAERKNPTFQENMDSTLPEGFLTRWKDLRGRVENASEMEKLKAVNLFFNQWPYRTDISNYGLEDYWATPREFIKKSGDCEDYAIVKFFALKYLGIPEERMRVVVIKDTIRNIAHAVLAVYTNDNIYILDNLSNVPLSHKTIKNYLPFYSLNREFRWAHLPVKK